MINNPHMAALNVIVLTNEDRTKFSLGVQSDVDKAIDMDNGTVSPCMGLPKKYFHLDCILLIMPA